MSTPSLAIVLHGARWPAADAGAAWRDRLARLAGRPVELILARDEVRTPRGAAACIADALRQTTATQVIVAEVFAQPSDALLRGLIDAIATTAALAAPLPADPPVAPTTPIGTVDREPPRFDEPAVWAVRAEVLANAGGLDETLWSFGVFEDVAAKVTRRGGTIARVDGEVTVSEQAYAPGPALECFLRWRNRLRLSVAHTPAATLGPVLLPTVLGLLDAAWHAAGLDAKAIRFGGTWGRASISRRVRAHLGGPAPDDLWPADEAGTAIPLAALQAFALDLPGLVERRAPDLRERVVTPTDDEHAPVPASSRPRALALPRVSVIVVNWNGRTHLEDCFAALLANDYPRDLVELICVDNGSADDSVAFLRERFPEVRIVALSENRGFTGGNAAGVEAATGDVFVFVNNDMKFEPTFLSRLIAGLGDDGACAAARVMSWDGQAIDFVRGTASFEARGFQEHFGERYAPGTALAESFFPNGGAFAVTRQAYEEAGGFDPALFAYYDDVDLGWRLRMAGHTIRTAPDAVAYHRHNATVATQPHAHKRFLMARNALWTMVRNYDDATLPHVLPAVLLLAGLRVAQDTSWLRTPLARLLRPWVSPRHRGQVPEHAYAIDGASSAPAVPARILARIPMPEFAAIGALLEDLPRLARVRAEQQARRRVPDTQVLPFLGRPFQELDGRRTYRAAQKALVDVLSLRGRLGVRPHVVLITHEALRTKMSGPAIRVLEMARALSRTARVTVMAPGPLEVSDDRVALVPYDPARPDALQAQAESADAIVVQGFALSSYPFLTRLVCPIVADLYCPFTIEHLEQARAAGAPIPASVEQEAASILAVQNAQLQQADFFICASERQRDFWIGTLHTAGRVNARTVARDPDLRRLIDVVPFGLPSESADDAASRARSSREARGLPAGVMKGVHPAIRPSDRVLLWGGSLLDWQDPETLITAVARIARVRDDVKLFFMGVKHPNPLVKPMAVVERSQRLAESLGVAGTHVIFNDWVPYDERALYLLEADLGVSTHHAHLETRYAYRTRMLDYLWARLPIVCTNGDYFGDLVASNGLGRAVPPGDPDALASAILALLDDEEARTLARAHLADVAATMTWDRVVEPLRRWAASPAFAADREGDVAAFRATLANSYRASRWVKRTALRLGVNERTWEQLKQLKVVRAAMSVRNSAAIARARRKARPR